MQTLNPIVELNALELQPLYEKLQRSVTLVSLVLAVWQIGLWFARALVNHRLNERAQQPQSWGNCHQCGSRLESKGFVNRRMLDLSRMGRVATTSRTLPQSLYWQS